MRIVINFLHPFRSFEGELFHLRDQLSLIHYSIHKYKHEMSILQAQPLTKLATTRQSLHTVYLPVQF